METLAFIIELVWRALCDHATYLPTELGSAWLTDLAVVDGQVVFGDHRLPAAELDLRMAGMTMSLGI
jgi:hypothetical protein